jgi:hypothetical protein
MRSQDKPEQPGACLERVVVEENRVVSNEATHGELGGARLDGELLPPQILRRHDMQSQALR